MAWFRNYYECARCGAFWTDEWSCMCDDDCRQCGARHMSPVRSDDLTEVVWERNDDFVVLRSPPSAEREPDYLVVAQFASRREAEAYIVREPG